MAASKLRIVSLVPSLTHMICDFGLKDAVVGATKFCVAPPDLARRATLVGGTKDPDLEAIRALKPTHILVNEEENKPEHIAACRAMATTFVTFPKSPEDVPALLREAGKWLEAARMGEQWAQKVEDGLRELDVSVASAARTGRWAGRQALYLIWREPYMVVAADTYISAMLTRLKIENVAPRAPRYPEMTVAQMRDAAPGMLLLSSEPYPFRQRDAERLRADWPEAPEMLKIDGQLMSWYGTMLLEATKAMSRWVAGHAQEIVKPL